LPPEVSALMDRLFDKYAVNGYLPDDLIEKVTAEFEEELQRMGYHKFS